MHFDSSDHSFTDNHYSPASPAQHCLHDGCHAPLTTITDSDTSTCNYFSVLLGSCHASPRPPTPASRSPIYPQAPQPVPSYSPAVARDEPLTHTMAICHQNWVLNHATGRPIMRLRPCGLMHQTNSMAPESLSTTWAVKPCHTCAQAQANSSICIHSMHASRGLVRPQAACRGHTSSSRCLASHGKLLTACHHCTHMQGTSR